MKIVQPLCHSRPLRFEPLEDRRMLATITVNTLVDQADGSIIDGTISLRDAIAKAGTSDVINFSPALTSGGPSVLKLTLGALLIDRTRTIQGPGADKLTIDASGNDPTPLLNNGDGSRVVTIVRDPNRLSPITVAISGLTLAGGDMNGDGGGIYNEENLTVSDCAVLGNAATLVGGGVFNETGNLSIVNSSLTGNVAGQRGGGLGSLSGAVNLNNDSISANSAPEGGGIYNLAGLSVVGCTIANNTVSATVQSGGTIIGSMGAGIDNAGGQATIVSSTISGNALQWTAYGDVTVDSSGGAGISNAASLTLTGSTVSGNSLTFNRTAGSGHSNGAVGGVGIFNIGTFTSINSTISYNLGSNGGNMCSGGGIFDGGSCTILCSTIANNSADSSGGGITGSIESLVNTLVVNNSSAGALLGNVNLNGSYVGSFDIIGSIPLGSLQDNGGPTFTQALPVGSSAIDAGNPASVPGVDGIPTNDQRGAPYTRRYNGRIDVGAFEFQPTSTPALPGDFNRNNVVDAADYVLWRNTLGTSVTSYSGADGNGDGTITQSDYDVWRAHFGQSSAAGSAEIVDTQPVYSAAASLAAPPMRSMSAGKNVSVATSMGASKTQSPLADGGKSFGSSFGKTRRQLNRITSIFASDTDFTIVDWLEKLRGRSPHAFHFEEDAVSDVATMPDTLITISSYDAVIESWWGRPNTPW